MNEKTKKLSDEIFETPQNHFTQNIRGRGALSNDTGRFEKVQKEADLSMAGWVDVEEFPSLKTEFYKDTSKTIVNKIDSPDRTGNFSINPYRGCEHGCIYCYARPTHEYLGFSAGLDFESKIFVKEDAAVLLREKFMSRNWEPDTIMISGVTDCYQPAERKFQITRQCLEVLAEFKNPASLITKNYLITRDLDILSEMAKDNLVHVTISVTTLDAHLARVMEPRTSSPDARLKAIEMLSQAGIPVGVNVAPVVPGLTDHEMPLILKAAAEAGATSAGYVMLRLPHSVKDLFVQWLEENRPERKNKVIGHLLDVRGGKLYRADPGTRFTGEGPIAEHIAKMFRLFSAKYGLDRNRGFSLETKHFRRPGDQMSLF